MLLAVVLLAILEGLTEFLPISSSGHLVVAGNLLHFNPVWREPFMILIQLGAIFAVILDRKDQMLELLKKNLIVPFGIKVGIGVAPFLVLGFLLKDIVSELLRSSFWVALAWIVGGVAILIIDRPGRAEGGTTEIEAITTRQAVLVGLAQCLSLWTGMSRSGSTILGGLLLGLNRSTATVFSFYLAIPTMMAASGYQVLKHRAELASAGAEVVLGMAISFFVAWATVRWLLRFVQTHTFRGFAIYRIVAGFAIMFLPAEWTQENE